MYMQIWGGHWEFHCRDLQGADLGNVCECWYMQRVEVGTGHVSADICREKW